jgi:hypothetical protein
VFGRAGVTFGVSRPTILRNKDQLRSDGRAMLSGAIRDAFHTCHTRAVGGAVEVTVCLHAVPDHLDAAVLAGWCEGVDCALEAVEGARFLAGHAYLKSLVILVSTNFALGHVRLLLPTEAG